MHAIHANSVISESLTTAHRHSSWTDEQNFSHFEPHTANSMQWNELEEQWKRPMQLVLVLNCSAELLIVFLFFKCSSIVVFPLKVSYYTLLSCFLSIIWSQPVCNPSCYEKSQSWSSFAFSFFRKNVCFQRAVWNSVCWWRHQQTRPMQHNKHPQNFQWGWLSVAAPKGLHKQTQRTKIEQNIAHIMLFVLIKIRKIHVLKFWLVRFGWQDNTC